MIYNRRRVKFTRKNSGIAALMLVLALASSMSALIYTFIEQSSPYLQAKQYREAKDRSVSVALSCREAIFAFFLENPEYDRVYNLNSNVGLGNFKFNSEESFAVPYDGETSTTDRKAIFHQPVSCEVLNIEAYTRYLIGNEPTEPTDVARSLRMNIHGVDIGTDTETKIEVVFDIAKHSIYSANEASSTDANSMRSGVIINIATREI